MGVKSNLSYFRFEGTGNDRKLYIGEILSESDEPDLLFESALNSDSGNLEVRINSHGGDLLTAFKTYTALSSYPGYITAYIDVVAASAASVIMVAADEINMYPVSLVNIHNPQVASFGNEKDMQNAVLNLQEIKEAIIGAYLARSNIKLNHDEISELMDKDILLSANTALSYGLCDSIVTVEESIDAEEDLAEIQGPNEVESSSEADYETLMNELELLKLQVY
jgi:ATP-dependent Clp protease protease subunit